MRALSIGAGLLLVAATALSSSASAQQQGDASELPATQGQVARVEQQLQNMQNLGRALEENRLQRASWFAEASAWMLDAQYTLGSGSNDVSRSLTTAQSLLWQATMAASNYGGADEVQNGQYALSWMAGALKAIENDDLYNARLDLTFAIFGANAAQAACQASAQPQFKFDLNPR